MLSNHFDGFYNKLYIQFCCCLLGTFMVLGKTPDVPRNQSEEVKIVKIGPLAMEAVFVQGGTFEMGDHFRVGESDELPVHQVSLSDFYMSTTEVTAEQYKAYCRQTDRKMPLQEEESKDDYPVVFITWFEANDFCEWVGGELPTEAQWEYAATARGLVMRYPTGNEIDHSMANFSDTGKKDRWKRLAPVAKFPPNMLGIYDLAGNVYEWCYDYYKSDSYNMPAYLDPRGTATSMFKVLRGGSWYHDKEQLRCSDRFRYMPVARMSFVGFRVVWDTDKVQTK